MMRRPNRGDCRHGRIHPFRGCIEPLIWGSRTYSRAAASGRGRPGAHGKRRAPRRGQIADHSGQPRLTGPRDPVTFLWTGKSLLDALGSRPKTSSRSVCVPLPTCRDLPTKSPPPFVRAHRRLGGAHARPAEVPSTRSPRQDAPRRGRAGSRRCSTGSTTDPPPHATLRPGASRSRPSMRRYSRRRPSRAPLSTPGVQPGLRPAKAPVSSARSSRPHPQRRGPVVCGRAYSS